MTATTAPKIRADGLGKTYGDKEVFHDLTFDVAEGEIVSIVGPSGCGKTTLLRCVVGLIAPTRGSVSINEQRVLAPTEGVAMVFQHFGLFPWKTVAANVAYGLTVQGISRRASAPKVQELINLVGLQGFEKSSAPALRRDAAAGRSGPSARHRTQRVGDGRALRLPRRADA